MNASISYSFNPLWRDGGTTVRKQRMGSQRKKNERKEEKKEYSTVDWNFYRLVKWQLDNKICLEAADTTTATACICPPVINIFCSFLALFLPCWFTLL